MTSIKCGTRSECAVIDKHYLSRSRGEGTEAIYVPPPPSLPPSLLPSPTFFDPLRPSSLPPSLPCQSEFERSASLHRATLDQLETIKSDL